MVMVVVVEVAKRPVQISQRSLPKTQNFAPLIRILTSLLALWGGGWESNFLIKEAKRREN